jgi:hypothetical protein
MIQKHLDDEMKQVKDKERLLETRKKELVKTKYKIANIIDLYHEGELSKQAFHEHHSPLYDEQNQIEQSILDLSTEIDASKMQSLDNRQILHDAQYLSKQWKSFNVKEKKSIVEAITKSIVVGKEDIEINLAYIPTLAPIGAPTSPNDGIMQQTPMGSLSKSTRRKFGVNDMIVSRFYLVSY